MRRKTASRILSAARARVRCAIAGTSLALALTALIASPAHADSTPPAPSVESKRTQYWSPHFRKVGALDYVWTGVNASALTLELIFLQSKSPPLRWTEPILFDRGARDALALSSESAQATIGTVSWSIFGAAILYPVAVDVPVAAVRGGGELAQQFFWQTVVVLSTAAVVDIGIRELVGRARPLTYDCLVAGGGERCVEERESTRSFPNGHFAVGTASAALTCTQHLNTRLYGGPWDAVTCASAIAANATMGVMRIMADKHWATDTIFGGALGVLIGWGLPTLLYYRGGPIEPATAPKQAMGSAAKLPGVLPMPFFSNRALGLGLTGLF